MKFKKLVVVSFGTTFFHSQEEIEALSQVLISHSEIGFVVSMKPSYPGFELL
jgi:glutamate/tyrosine decarboxylase-like PLP-dependent enzyme